MTNSCPNYWTLDEESGCKEQEHGAVAYPGRRRVTRREHPTHIWSYNARTLYDAVSFDCSRQSIRRGPSEFIERADDLLTSTDVMSVNEGSCVVKTQFQNDTMVDK